MFKNIRFNTLIGLSVISILSILIATGCNSMKVSSNNIAPKSTTQMLSLSCFETNADISLYKLDANTKQTDLLKTQITPGEFTPNVLSDDGNLYYPKRDSSGKFVQLFRYNLASRKEIQLTSLEKNDTVLVEYLDIDNETSKLFMRILRKNHDNSELAVYNIKTGKMDVFGDNDRDIEVLNFDICKDKKLVAVATYSKAENINKMDKANKNQLSLEPTQRNITIYDENGNIVKECKPINDFVTDISLSPDARLLLFSINTEWLDDSHSKKNIVCTQNVETGEIKQVLKSSDQYREIGNARFSADGKGFFYLATKPDAKSFVNNGGYTKVPNTIFYYDLQTKQSKEIWSANNKTITNYVVLDK
ncbi:hypothetical protein ACPUYX_10170 [Desulfosporosinus sp. SYSU MS00001]|uniref:hypothetical protein n=1 Tax=Desulfosporosinus sp. SYSU MS00001 TaxID=3416284 RepID=UPI003CF40633